MKTSLPERTAPLNVAQVTWSLKTGGLEMMVLDLVRLCPEFSVRPMVAVVEEAGDLAGEVTAMGVPFVLLGKRRGIDPGLVRRLASLVRLEEVKGPDLAIEALAQLDDVRLIMVGAGSLEASLRSDAARLGVEDRVIFAGECEHKDVPRYLAASDLLLLPSRSEGQPNAVLEALSAQRPVVATSVGGVPELIEDGRQGALCAPEDPDALALAIGRVLAKAWNPRELSEPLGQRSWASSAEGLMAVLNEAIAGD